MEHFKELMHQATSAFIFCAAVVILMLQYKNYNSLLIAVHNSLSNKDALILESRYEADNTLSYAELVATLLDEQEYDIEIDGLLISKHVHTTEKIDSYHLKNARYSKAYFYDSDGRITRIIYKSLS